MLYPRVPEAPVTRTRCRCGRGIPESDLSLSDVLNGDL